MDKKQFRTYFDKEIMTTRQILKEFNVTRTRFNWYLHSGKLTAAVRLENANLYFRKDAEKLFGKGNA